MATKLETMKVVDKRFPRDIFMVISRRDFNPKIHTAYDPRAPKKKIVDKAEDVPQSFVDDAKSASDWAKFGKTSHSSVGRQRNTKTK